MTVSARRSWIAPTLAVTAASAIALAAPTFPLDDAYITLHNARALLAGGWDATYGTSALTGATSLIHLLLVAALGLLLPLPAASWLVTIAGTALYAAGLDRMAVQAGVGRVTVVVTGLFSGYMLFNLVNGLETGLALAAMTWALVLIDHRRLPVLLGVLPFIRPEFTLLSLPLLAHCCWRDRADLGRVAEHLAWFGAAALPWLLVTWTMTGSPVPATASAKVAFFGEEHEPLLRKVVDALWIIGVSAVGPLLAGLAGLRRARGGWAVAVFVVLWLSAITLTFPGGINHNYFRYLTLIVPAALYGATIRLGGANGRATSRILLVWAMFSSLLAGHALYITLPNPRYLQLGADAAILPRNARVLVHDAGYLAWVRPDLRIVDLVGLKTPSSAALHARLSAPSGSTRRAIDTIARTSDARILIALSREPFWSAVVTDLDDDGWGLVRLNPADHAYGIFRLTPPPATGYAAP